MSMNANTVFGSEPVKLKLGRPNTKQGDNIKMDLREVGCEESGWIQMAQNHACRWALILGVFEHLVSATGVLKISVSRGMTPCRYVGTLCDVLVTERTNIRYWGIARSCLQAACYMFRLIMGYYRGVSIAGKVRGVKPYFMFKNS
jgi:hypothetical protein